MSCKPVFNTIAKYTYPDVHCISAIEKASGEEVLEDVQTILEGSDPPNMLSSCLTWK